MRSFYTDIERYLELTDEQLNFVLAAWCRYRERNGCMVDVLVDHVHRLDHCRYRALTRPFFTSSLESFRWISEFEHHVKAITLASCKHNRLNTPQMVLTWLVANRNVNKDVLLDTIKEEQPLTLSPE